MMNNKNYENSETLAFFYMHPRVCPGSGTQGYLEEGDSAPPQPSAYSAAFQAEDTIGFDTVTGSISIRQAGRYTIAYTTRPYVTYHHDLKVSVRVNGKEVPKSALIIPAPQRSQGFFAAIKEWVFAKRALQNQTIYGRRISTALSADDTVSIVTEELTEKPARPVDALRQMPVSIMILSCL